MNIEEFGKYIHSDEVEVLKPFGPSIYGGTISEEMHNALLEVSERSRQNKDNDYRFSLAGNLSEEYNVQQLINEYPIIEEELTHHLALYDVVSGGERREMWLHSLKRVQIESLWVNYMKAFEWNPEHAHSGDMSFVIYLKVPNDMNKEKEHETQKGNSPTAGTITFAYGEDLIYNQSRLNIEPKERDILVFPNWLRHQVYPFTTDVERVSVAGNAYKVTLKEQHLQKMIEDHS